MTKRKNIAAQLNDAMREAGDIAQGKRVPASVRSYPVPDRLPEEDRQEAEITNHPAPYHLKRTINPR